MLYTVPDSCLLAALAEVSLRSCHLCTSGVIDQQKYQRNYAWFIIIFASLQRTLSQENGLRIYLLRLHAAPSKMIKNVKVFSH